MPPPVPPAGGAGDSSDDDLEDVVESERPVKFAIKCGLRGLVRLTGDKRRRFLSLIDRTVDYVSWMRVRASHIASTYYLDACERVELDESNGRHLPLDDLPPFTHAGNGGRWWRQILYDVNERRRPLDKFSTQHGKRDIEEKLRRETDELIRIKNEHFNAEKYPPQPAKPQYVSHVLNSCALRIASEFCSHLRTNFFARQRAAHAAFLIRLGPEAIPIVFICYTQM